MARRLIGITPVQVALRNTRRHMLSAQYIPSSILPGNTGLVFGKFGSAPVASETSNTWDFILNPGAADGVNLFETKDRAFIEQDLWLISDTPGQIVNVVENILPDGEKPAETTPPA